MCDVLAACPISIRTDETATTFSFVNRLPICDCLMQTERNHRKEGQEQGEREGGGAGRKQNRQTRDYELIVGRCEPIGAIVGQRVSRAVLASRHTEFEQDYTARRGTERKTNAVSQTPAKIWRLMHVCSLQKSSADISCFRRTDSEEHQGWMTPE